MLGMLLIEAGTADAAERQLVMRYLVPVLFPHRLVQIGVRQHGVKVQYGAAPDADEVAVRGDVGVKPLLPFHHADAFDQPLLPEEGEVPINRPQTEVGVRRL